MRYRITDDETEKSVGAKKAAGPDGCARLECKQLTLEMYDDQDRRDSAVWPAAASTAAVALILKEANQVPAQLHLRPITVTCLLYNLWARTRFVDVTWCCKTWLSISLTEGIPENRMQECVWTALLAMEGEKESSELFDMIVWEVEKMRVADRVWKLQASFVFHLKRFFRRGQSCCDTWKALNGVVQGCSLRLVTSLACGRHESTSTRNQSHHHGRRQEVVCCGNRESQNP